MKKVSSSVTNRHLNHCTFLFLGFNRSKPNGVFCTCIYPIFLGNSQQCPPLMQRLLIQNAQATNVHFPQTGVLDSLASEETSSLLCVSLEVSPAAPAASVTA